GIYEERVCDLFHTTETLEDRGIDDLYLLRAKVDVAVERVPQDVFLAVRHTRSPARSGPLRPSGHHWGRTSTRVPLPTGRSESEYPSMPTCGAKCSGPSRGSRERRGRERCDLSMRRRRTRSRTSECSVASPATKGT